MARKAPSAKSHPSRAKRRPFADRVVDETVALAEEMDWENVRLRVVAQRMGVSLADVVREYRDQDAVANAWFQRGWTAMLAGPPEGFAAPPAEERLYLIMMRWFDAFAGHREVTAQMIATKIYAPHPHHWVPLIFNLSRTIQWLRDAARLDAGGLRRQVEEVGLTALFLATLATWAKDDSENQERTRRFLRHRLADADRAMVVLWARAEPPGEA